MCDQVFKRDIPINLLFGLLEQICLKTEKYYLMDQNAYKKLIFHELFPDFKEELRGYYYISKRFYIDRELTYRAFSNIVRQVSKFLNIRFESEVKYHQSQYYMNYLIYHNGETQI